MDLAGGGWDIAGAKHQRPIAVVYVADVEETVERQHSRVPVMAEKLRRWKREWYAVAKWLEHHRR